jgi:hemoglobin
LEPRREQHYLYYRIGSRNYRRAGFFRVPLIAPADAGCGAPPPPGLVPRIHVAAMERFAEITEPAIAALVARFYAKARRDPLIGPVFNNAIDDWDEHLRTLSAFWSSVMLTSGRYKGNPMAAHLKLPIEPVFFERWLALWRETAAELFAPDPAAHFIAKAERIAESLKLALFYRPGAVHGAIAPARVPA